MRQWGQECADMRLFIAARIFAAIAITSASLQPWICAGERSTRRSRSSGRRAVACRARWQAGPRLRIARHQFRRRTVDVETRGKSLRIQRAAGPLTIVSGDALPATMADPGALRAHRKTRSARRNASSYSCGSNPGFGGANVRRAWSIGWSSPSMRPAPSPSETTLEDFSVPVRREAAVVLSPPFGLWRMACGRWSRERS